MFLWYSSPTKGVYPYFQLGPLPEILTIANLRHFCAQPEFRLCWLNLCSSDNHYTTALLHHNVIDLEVHGMARKTKKSEYIKNQSQLFNEMKRFLTCALESRFWKLVVFWRTICEYIDFSRWNVFIFYFFNSYPGNIYLSNLTIEALKKDLKVVKL